MARSNTTLRWGKIGLVYVANKESDFLYSHGKSRAIVKINQFIRAYTICYSKPASDGSVMSRTYYVDLDINNPTKVLWRSAEPVIEIGNVGDFDEHGVMAECVVRHGGELWMYYDGWSRKSSVPYEWSIGLAISQDGGNSYRKHGRGPVIGPCHLEPYLFAAPFVMSAGDDKWHMWYLGGDEWKIDPSGKPYAIYTLKHATSRDGVSWVRESVSCLKSSVEEECQAGPTVFEMNGIYHMIFSYRSAAKWNSQFHGYRLGHAISTDLCSWERVDELMTIEGRQNCWDSEMMCYPQVVQADGRTYLFYSGNGFGRSGFGVAELINS